MIPSLNRLGRLICVALTLAVGSASASERLSGVASVIDGDTLEIRGVRVRLHGIDAPESAQLCSDEAGKRWRCGQRAALALADRIGRRPVVCTRTDTDRYGRMVARCTVGGDSVNGWLVAEGWAVAYRRYADDYVAAESAAEAAGKGLWSGRFVMPWDWRRGARVQQDAKPPAERSAGDCAIKGNISRDGARIFHVPGGRFYARTKIDKGKGEQWFCSAEEAVAAGWRPSAR